MSKHRILLVDDEEAIITALQIRLEYQGYDVLTANDGEAGLEKARQETPDLIILDVMMPKMDGYKVCKLLKFDERFQKTPIIIMSALSQEEDQTLALEVGADRFLTKPYNSTELLGVIEELLAKASN